MKTTEQLLADLSEAMGDKANLKAGATLPKDLVSAANSITELTARIAALESDKAKLTADVAAITKERDDAKAEVTKVNGDNATLKSEKTTVEAAVAKKVAELGLSDGGGKQPDAKSDEKLTATEKVMKAKGVKTLDELYALKK